MDCLIERVGEGMKGKGKPERLEEGKPGGAGAHQGEGSCRGQEGGNRS